MSDGTVCSSARCFGCAEAIYESRVATDVAVIRNLMAPDEFKNLGFADEKAPAVSSKDDKGKNGR